MDEGGRKEYKPHFLAADLLGREAERSMSFNCSGRGITLGGLDKLAMP